MLGRIAIIIVALAACGKLAEPIPFPDTGPVEASGPIDATAADAPEDTSDAGVEDAPPETSPY